MRTKKQLEQIIQSNERIIKEAVELLERAGIALIGVDETSIKGDIEDWLKDMEG